MIFQPVFIILISVLKLGISHITDKSSNAVFLYIFLILLPVLQRQQFHLLIQSGIFPFYFLHLQYKFSVHLFPETDADILIVCILQIDSNTESQISFLFFGNPLCLFHVRTSLSGDRTFQNLPICTLYKYLIRLQLVYNPASDCQDTLLCNLFLINMIFNKTFLTKSFTSAAVASQMISFSSPALSASCSFSCSSASFIISGIFTVNPTFPTSFISFVSFKSLATSALSQREGSGTKSSFPELQRMKSHSD